MVLSEILKALQAMTPAEIIGTIFGLVSVYLTVRQNIWCWPTGIISTIAFGFLFYDIKLYADLYLQIFFTLTSFQGWYYWLHGGMNQDNLPITFLTARERILLACSVPVAIFLVGLAFARYTDAHLPFWDATASGLSVLAQILLMRKKFENWHLWIVVDILSIGIYIYKHVYLTAILYVVFLVLAVLGLVAWRKEWNERNAPKPA